MAAFLRLRAGSIRSLAVTLEKGEADSRQAGRSNAMVAMDTALSLKGKRGDRGDPVPAQKTLPNLFVVPDERCVSFHPCAKVLP